MRQPWRDLWTLCRFFGAPAWWPDWYYPKAAALMDKYWQPPATPELPRLMPNGHYAVDWIGMQYRPAGEFNWEAHDAWVEQGHCPVVSMSKAWCCNRPHGIGNTDHRSITDHQTPQVLGDGPRGTWSR